MKIIHEIEDMSASEEAKNLVDSGCTLEFVYPGITGRYVPARYYIRRGDYDIYQCDVLYQGEVLRKARWKAQNFDLFVRSLPYPVIFAEDWQVVEDVKK